MYVRERVMTFVFCCGAGVLKRLFLPALSVPFRCLFFHVRATEARSSACVIFFASVFDVCFLVVCGVSLFFRQPTPEKVYTHRRPVMIGVALMLLQAFTGINTVVFYSTTIFELAGVQKTVSLTGGEVEYAKLR